MNLLSVFRNPMLLMPMVLLGFMGLSKLLPTDLQELQREMQNEGKENEGDDEVEESRSR